MGDEQKHGESPELPGLIDKATLTIKFALRGHETDTMLLIDLDLSRGRPPYAPAATVGVAGAMFDSAEQANEWLRRASELYFDEDMLKRTVADALRLWFTDATSLALIEAGVAPYTIEGLPDSHGQVADLLLRQRLGLSLPIHGWPRWTQIELANAIFAAMRAAAPRTPTYENAARELQKMYPGRPPTTGEALRKVVKEYKIKWMRLKTRAKKRSS